MTLNELTYLMLGIILGLIISYVAQLLSRPRKKKGEIPEYELETF